MEHKYSFHCSLYNPKKCCFPCAECECYCSCRCCTHCDDCSFSLGSRFDNWGDCEPSGISDLLYAEFRFY